MQWEPGEGRRRAGSRYAGLETSNDLVGKRPHVVATTENIIAGGGVG